MGAIQKFQCYQACNSTTKLNIPLLKTDIDIADQQNAHGMTVAVNGVVELYKAVKREKELLAFPHDHRSVGIYGHYTIIEEEKTTFHRHPIHEFSFTALDLQLLKPNKFLFSQR